MCASGVLRKSPIKFFIRANFCKNLGGIRANFCKDLGGICNKNPGKTLWSWCLFVIKCAFRAYGKQLNNVLNVHQLTKKTGILRTISPKCPKIRARPDLTGRLSYSAYSENVCTQYHWLRMRYLWLQSKHLSDINILMPLVPLAVVPPCNQGRKCPLGCWAPSMALSVNRRWKGAHWCFWR